MSEKEFDVGDSEILLSLREQLGLEIPSLHGREVHRAPHRPSVLMLGNRGGKILLYNGDQLAASVVYQDADSGQVFRFLDE